MSIQGECPGCSKPYRVPDEAVGRTAACPACKTKFQIVATPAEEAADQGYELADEPVKPKASPAIRKVVVQMPGDQPAVLASTRNAAASAVPEVGHDPFALAGSSAEPSTFVPAKPKKKRKRLAESSEESASSTSWSFPAGRRGGSPASLRYCWFALALLPLLLWIAVGENDTFARFLQAAEEHPEVLVALEEREAGSITQLYDITTDALPSGALPGAHLSRKSWMHLLYAGLSAVGMFALLIATLPLGNSRPLQLAGVALAVAVGGVFLLFMLQGLADFSAGLRGGRGIIGMFIALLKLIGYSYYAASDPNSGFLLSLFGFTLGVGLCEELIKALPVIAHFRGEPELDWQAACAWGAACGLGFGVAEGIIYSVDFYNGIETWDIYIVRFVSCVALHAIWSATVGILVWQNQALLEGELDWMEYGQAMFYILGGPVVLHGLYDTLLKKEMPWGALLVAMASFGLLAGVIELNRRERDWA